MKAAFDDTAHSYDDDFTNTPIGRLQRNKVWSYLQRTYGDRFPENILELNCGTGEDAVFFAEHHSKVLATDVSEQMLTGTRNKVRKSSLDHLVKTQQLDLNEFPAELPSNQFDLLFSNFGGLNCISSEQLQRLLEKAPHLLTPGARVILVIMPRFCAWETIYFSSKLAFKKAFRRRTKKPQKADLGNSFVETWYHSPGDIKRMAAKHYDIVNIQPIGISIPPSYFKKTFLTKPGILNKLNALENSLGKYSFFSAVADHYLIDLKLK
jgi:ubiquinone/menaquinone biosynthesis C-methylase UbiE